MECHHKYRCHHAPNVLLVLQAVAPPHLSSQIGCRIAKCLNAFSVRFPLFKSRCCSKFSAVVRSVVASDLTHACFPMGEGSHDNSLPMTQAPLFFCPLFVHLHIATFWPGCRSGALMFRVFLKSARRRWDCSQSFATHKFWFDSCMLFLQLGILWR